MSTDNEENRDHSLIKGPSLGITDNLPKREMWKEVAEEYNGEFKIKHDAGHVLETHNISIPHKKWVINISVSDSRPLKFQIDFSASQEFNLQLSWEDFVEKMLKKFRKSKIEVGWKEFDNRYLIKSNRSDLAKQTITSDIQKMLLKHNVYSISYHSNMKSRTAEMVSVIQRKAGNKEMIIELIAMYKLLIDNLEELRVVK